MYDGKARREGVIWRQCDQIGQVIPLWATFQSQWQQIFCPNNLGIFVKASKIFHFSRGIIFWATFIDI